MDETYNWLIQNRQTIAKEIWFANNQWTVTCK